MVRRIYFTFLEVPLCNFYLYIYLFIYLFSSLNDDYGYLLSNSRILGDQGRDLVIERAEEK